MYEPLNLVLPHIQTKLDFRTTSLTYMVHLLHAALQRIVATFGGCFLRRLYVFFDDAVVVAAIIIIGMVLFDIPSNDVPAFLFPFGTVHGCVIQIFVAGYTEHTAFAQFLRQRDDVEIEETDLAFVPVIGGIRIRSSVDVGLVHFRVQPFVPLDVNVPMLHRVGNIRRLDDVFDDDRRLPIDILFLQVGRPRRRRMR